MGFLSTVSDAWMGSEQLKKIVVVDLMCKRKFDTLIFCDIRGPLQNNRPSSSVTNHFFE